MPKYPALGPHQPVNLVYTHNMNKQNQDAAYDVHVHLFDKTDKLVAATSILALNDNLWQLAELNDLDLLDEQHAHGWQHIFVHSSFQTPPRAGMDARGRATGKLMSQEKIREVYNIVLRDMERRTGLDLKKQIHWLRGAGSKRKSTEHGDHLTTEKDMGYEPSRFAKHYNQEIVSVKTVAAGMYADVRHLAKGEYIISSFIPRRDVDVPAALLSNTLHPSLRRQLGSDALLQICKERGQETERGIYARDDPSWCSSWVGVGSPKPRGDGRSSDWRRRPPHCGSRSWCHRRGTDDDAKKRGVHDDSAGADLRGFEALRLAERLLHCVSRVVSWHRSCFSDAGI